MPDYGRKETKQKITVRRPVVPKKGTWFKYQGKWYTVLRVIKVIKDNNKDDAGNDH